MPNRHRTNSISAQSGVWRLTSMSQSMCRPTDPLNRRVLAVSLCTTQECAARKPHHRRGPLNITWSQPRSEGDVVQAGCRTTAALSFAADVAVGHAGLDLPRALSGDGQPVGFNTRNGSPGAHKFGAKHSHSPLRPASTPTPDSSSERVHAPSARTVRFSIGTSSRSPLGPRADDPAV